MAEHSLGDMTVWNGNGGKTYFYQNELPYDVTQERFGDSCGYRVLGRNHETWGVGIYSYFKFHPVVVRAGIVVPTKNDFAKMHNAFIWKIPNSFGGIAWILRAANNNVAGTKSLGGIHKGTPSISKKISNSFLYPEYYCPFLINNTTYDKIQSYDHFISQYERNYQSEFILQKSAQCKGLCGATLLTCACDIACIVRSDCCNDFEMVCSTEFAKAKSTYKRKKNRHSKRENRKKKQKFKANKKKIKRKLRKKIKNKFK